MQESFWSTVWSWPLEVKIGLVLSATAAVGALKILRRKRAKPKLVNPELFIKPSGSIKNTLLFRCIVRNSGSKLCSIENVKIEFDGGFSFRKGGCVNISSASESERNVASTTLPVNAPANDGAARVISVGHISGSTECPSRAKIEITFSDKTTSISEIVPRSKHDIITWYGPIR